ncbi:hypothetical protein [Helicobacter pylori]|uniref:hypothetical protein n=1 Tax=Helicobacter pylori TaxID=210 RepID=UPI0011B2899C|nr:hypothetical protein [Helicobacter pylori]
MAEFRFFSYASANAYALKIALRFLKTSNKLTCRRVARCLYLGGLDSLQTISDLIPNKLASH